MPAQAVTITETASDERAPALTHGEGQYLIVWENQVAPAAGTDVFGAYVTDQYPGDVDDDGDVDVFDVIDTINAFGSQPGDPTWNPGADFDRSGTVDIFDVITVVMNFGHMPA